MTLIGHIVGTKGNTGRGIASIVENADYTITINLTDGTSYTTAPIAGFTEIEFDENYDLVVTKTDGTTETVETDIEAFRTVLAGYKSDAETAESNASGYATAASGSASTATAKAKEAESYAKGGTSSRTGEDTDNADYYRGLAAASATAAGTSESNAGTQALKSEGYAVGKQNGTDVSSGSDYYHNNAKHYSDLASTAETNAETAETNASTSATNANADALKAEGYAVGKQNGTTVISGTYYHNNAMYYNSQATNMASLATNKANSAGTDALKAEGFSVGEQNGTPVTSDSPYYENNAKYYSEEAAASAASLTVDDELDGSSTNPVQNKVIKDELDSKANVDGYYESLGSGTADQLASNIYEEDNTPYNFRTSGGSIDIGDRETDMLVGGTVAWNQLAKEFSQVNWVAENGVTIDFEDDVLVVSSTTVNNGAYCGTLAPFKNGHKYLVTSKVKTEANLDIVVVGGLSSTGVTKAKSVQAGQWVDNSYVAQSILDGTSRLYCYARNTQYSNLRVKDFMVFDLTQMFGSTIADYIYSLETANAGAGVAWFKKLFPKPYYAYNAGELMSVNASAHNTVGFNAWDEEWEVGGISNSTGANTTASNQIRSKNFIPMLPNTSYYFRAPSNMNTYNVQSRFYDADKNYIGTGGTWYCNDAFTTPSDAHYFRFAMQTNYGTTYNNDITINLSWDGERDGEYEAYVKHSYPLDSSLTLRGIPKLDASNNLYYDGDTYESDGTVTRKYGIVDLGSLSWGYNSGTQQFRAGLSPAPVMYTASTIGNAICTKYPIVSSNTLQSSDKAGSIFYASVNGINIKDSDYTDAATFKAAMSGVYLVYELATPTTETADPYTNPQIVNDFGTEEYVDYAVSQGLRDVAIPVGHETQYIANLKAKLEMSPNSPEGAGDYIVRQTNGENEYVTLESNATIQDIIARLEALEGGGE